MTGNVVEIREGQFAREQKIAEIVKSLCPGLYLHSRAGRGVIRASVPRLRFDKRSALRWFWRIFGSAGHLDNNVVMTITAKGRQSLNLAGDWPEVEIHLYDLDFLKKAQRLALEYKWQFSRSAVLIVDLIAKQSRWRPFFRFAAFTLALATVVVGLRLLSLHFIKSFLSLLF